MGLGDTKFWKGKWRELAPDAFRALLELTDTMAAIEYVLEDAQGTMYTLATGVSDAGELEARIRNYVAEQLLRFSHVRGMAYVGDTRRKPANKALRRDARTVAPIPADLAARHAGAFRWDRPEAEAWAALADALLAGAPPSKSPPFRRVMGHVMRTTPLRVSLFDWFADEIERVHADYASGGGGPWLMLDGLGTERVRTVGAGEDLLAAREHAADGACGDREGEADLQVVHVAERLLRHGRAVWVRSRDTDITLTLLLSAPRWPAGARVWLDLGGADIIDVGALHAGLAAWNATCDLRHAAPSVVISMLGLMGGSDYVEKPEGLGSVRLWTWYRAVGHDAFNPVPPLPAGPADAPAWGAWAVRAVADFVRGVMCTDAAAKAAKTPRGERWVELRVRRARNRRDRDGPAIGSWARKLRKRLPPPELAIAEAAGVTRHNGVPPRDADWILVYAAQVAWNTLYVAGVRVDPLEAVGGVSRWGWEAEAGVVRRAARVAWDLG